MRIACISYYLPPKDHIGAGYQMHYMANAYVHAGHQVTMFSPYAEPAAGALYDMRQVPVGARNRTFRFAWNLRRQGFSGFDLLHAGMDDYWLLGKKRPYHIRTFMGSCLAEAIHIQGVRGKVRMTLLGLTELAACAVANRKVCISQSTRHYIPFAREVIGCGIDTSVFKPGVAKAPKPTILFVGTLGFRKRGAALLDIFKREIHPVLPDAELWIVRDNTPLHEEGVHSFGYVSLEKLVELYQQAWVFCLPSSYEGFGVPYIEAMACGTAVTATPNVGALEVLENGKYGYIADLPELGQTIINLLNNQAERTRLEQLSLARAAEFSWDKVVESYLRLVPPGPDSKALPALHVSE